MTTVVSQNLESLVRSNLKLLGIPETQQEPIVDCHCKVSTQRVPVISGTANSGLAVDVPAISPQQAVSVSNTSVDGKMPFVDQSIPLAVAEPVNRPKILASQFVHGLKTIPQDVDLHPELPGNAPFILPAGITPDMIVQTQHLAAEEAYKEQVTKEERIAEESKFKAEQEAALLKAKVAALTAQSQSPVAVIPTTATTVPPQTVVTSSSNTDITVPPASAVIPPISSAVPSTTVTIKETFAPFPKQITLQEPSVFGFDIETILLFLFIALIVYRIRSRK